ncbi:MAG: bifunctional diaminohydroxyphosphoribosylaminopyrimidine deaminase/5-amino-6-(5-phosphoribosylamino)uracil reductase RibD [Tepidisphaeraceae bacterium]|jgi:diaminohydroxyphosphoribosylaminopyrimidine deaminase/5-amino-6-(5-phosphoribosylamino)uracil reductase
MASTADHAFMRRAIELAMRGRGGVEPNPMVGCVLAAGAKTIAESWHEQFGGPHAEPLALRTCGDAARGATVYVTLEPCCHERKKTPPCVPALIRAGVARIVAGCMDPNPMVNGQGLALLQQAGMAVEAGVLESECRQLLAPFIARTTYRRPYVTLKWAQTADGKMAGPMGRRMAISNAASTHLVHGLRARCDAIVVGVKTATNDDPLLTARVESSRRLLRVVLDPQRRLPKAGQLVRSASAESPVLVVCLAENAAIPGIGPGVEIVPVDADPLRRDRLHLRSVLERLAERGATHVVVEPGPGMIRAFCEANLADRLWVIRSPERLEDESAPAVPVVDWPAVAELEAAGDRLTEYLNPRSEVYFAAKESADMMMARKNAK